MRGNPKHFAGPVERLKPLDEATARAALSSPPAGIEVQDFVGDELIWAGDAVLASFLLSRSDDGLLRTIELGLSGSGEGYEDDFETIALALLDLAETMRARLYQQPFDRSGRLKRDEIRRIAADMRTRVPPPPRARSPQLLVDFYELTDEEADAYLRQHIARAPERLAVFPREVASLGGPADAQLDATPESLERLGSWLADSLPARYAGLREPTRDEQTYGAGLVQLTPRDWRRSWPDEPAGLPPWCAPEAEDARSPLPPAALWLVDGLGYYLAECVSRELGETRWTRYRAASRRLRDVDENVPVIATARGTFNAHSAAYVIVLNALAYHRHDPDALLRAYRRALEGLGT